MQIRQEPESWEAGYRDGLNAATMRPSSSPDPLAYSSGYIEGKAVRLSFAEIDSEQAVARIEEFLKKRQDS